MPLSAGRDAMVGYVLAGVKPPAGTVAFQVPVRFAGILVAIRPFVQRARADGYAVHVWLSGSAPDDAATYNAIIDTCAEGIMPAKPTLLESILDECGIVRPGARASTRVPLPDDVAAALFPAVATFSVRAT